MKPVWQGYLSFGLVNIPISLFSAVKSQTFGFTMLCGTCHNPISYKRWCDHCKKEVMWDNLVKGLKLKNDTYFVLTKENLKALKPLKTESISVIEFIDPLQINLIYFEKHYYLTPKKLGEKAYFLFVAALNKADKVAIGTFVMKDKEHVCVISPYQNALLLTTLNYEYEIKNFDYLETLKVIPKVSAEELKLALQLIEQRTKKKFDISDFKDSFAECLAATIKKNAGRRKAIVHDDAKPKKSLTDHSLMKSLKASLEKKAKTNSKSTRKKIIKK